MTQVTPVIRPLQSGDSQDLHSSILQLQEDLKIAVVSLTEPKVPTTVAIIENDVVGCLWSTATAPFDIDIGVRENYRGQGLSFSMLATWLKTLPENANGTVALSVTATSPAMRRVLEFARLRGDNDNNFIGDIEVARLVTFLEFSVSEVAPGLVLWLHAGNLQHFEAKCHCLDPSKAAQGRHPFVCVDVNMSVGISTWMPLNSKRGKGRHPIRLTDKSGTSRPGDNWLTEDSYYHPAQAWTCKPRIIRGCLSGERTAPETRNRVSAHIAAEMLERARRLLEGI